MILHDNILYLDYEDFKQSCINRRTAEKWDYAIIKSPLDRRVDWFVYDRILPKYQTLIKAILCKGQEPGEWYAQSQIQNWLPALPATDKEAMVKYVIQRAKPDYGTGELIDTTVSGLPQATIQYYMLQARWMLLLRDGYSAHKQELVALGVQNKEEFVALCKLVAGKPLQYNDSNLRGKIAKYNREGITSLINGNWGDQKARKVTDEILQYLIDYYGNGKKMEVPATTSYINAVADEKGWKGFPVSEATVYNNLHKTDVKQVWYLGRHGYAAWKNEYGYTMLRHAPSVPHALWIGDDTKVNLYYRVGKKVVSQLQVYAIVDACTGYWLGWAYATDKQGKSVSQDTVREASQHALERAGVAPYQWQYDNDKVNNFYKELNTLHFPCMPNNGQSKLIERMFGKLQRNYMRADDAFTGQNIQSKSLQSKVNMDTMKPYDTMQEAMHAQSMWFELMNNTPDSTGKTPKQRILAADTSEFTPWTSQDSMELFWVWNERTNTYRKHGIEMEKNGKTTTYEVRKNGLPDLAFIENNVGQRFTIKYNPNNLNEVALFAKGKRFVAMAQDVERVPVAVYDYTEGSRAAIDARLDLKKKQVRNTQLKALAASEVADAEGVMQQGYGKWSKDEINSAEAELYADAYDERVAAPTLTKKDIENYRRESARNGKDASPLTPLQMERGIEN